MSLESAEQKKVFEFLSSKYTSQESFTKSEMEQFVGWDSKKDTFKTYMSKQFKQLLIKSGDSYVVSPVFRSYSSWPNFRASVLTQKRKLRRDYQISCYQNVVIFEFFMPLRNEEHLREALDSLFFKDSIKFRLKAIKNNELVAEFPREGKEESEHHVERICSWLSNKFVGYSIHHVNGRFRVGDLRTKADVYEKAMKGGDPYLVDETTAVVRFVIPCGENSTPAIHHDSREDTQGGLPAKSALEKEAKLIRWFFDTLFVNSILEVVKVEDEIWLLESGMHSQLHIWKARD
jgi:hypothetical protein